MYEPTSRVQLMLYRVSKASRIILQKTLEMLFRMTRIEACILEYLGTEVDCRWPRAKER